VDTTGKITTVAGTGASGYTGDGGSATAAQLYFPEGVAVDASGNIFIADNFNAVIRKVDAVSKNISTFATDPNFFDLVSLAVDGQGNLYSADDFACVVRKITPGGTITVVAGMEFICGYAGDGGPATSAQLNANFGVAVDGNGNLYIGDSGNNVIRKVTPGGIISTIAGDGICGFSGDGGPAGSAELCFPLGLTVDAAGNLYLADEVNFRIRKISRGKINTVAGSGLTGYNGNGLPALSTNLDDPVSVAVNPKNKAAYLLDDQQNQVRLIH
jgi:sugar lactone lactonase YvrE